MTTLQTTEMKRPIGLIGLGLVGRALAVRLLGSGAQVLGHDLSESARAGVREVGGVVAPGAGAVFEACEVVILSLPTDVEVRGVLGEAECAFRSGQVVIDTTTGPPGAAVEFAAALGRHGVRYLDATVSGSSVQVEAGEALFMVGGDEETFRGCEGLFRALARQVIYAGPAGAGAKMKLVSNLVLGLNRAALAEGLALAAALELDAERALEVLRSSMAYSRIMDTKGGKMVRRDFTPQARLSQHLKDVRLMLEAGTAAGQRLPLTEAHRDLLELAERLGFGAEDNSAILCAVESLGRRKT